MVDTYWNQYQKEKKYLSYGYKNVLVKWIQSILSLLLFTNKYAHDRNNNNNNNNNNKQKHPRSAGYTMQYIKQSYYWLMIRNFVIILFSLSNIGHFFFFIYCIYWTNYVYYFCFVIADIKSFLNNILLFYQIAVIEIHINLLLYEINEVKRGSLIYYQLQWRIHHP